MTDLDTIFEQARPTPRMQSIVDQLLAYVSDEHAGTIRGWLTDHDIGHAHLYRALTTLVAEVYPEFRPKLSQGGILKWRQNNR